MVGQDYGAEDYDGIKRTALRSFGLTTVISVVLAGVFMLWPELIGSIFNLDSELSTLLVAVLWVVALSFIVDAWQLLAINLLRGMKIVVGPTVVTAVGYWLFGLPAAWLLLPDFGLGGIWGGIGIGLGVTGVLLLVQLLLAIKKQRNTDSLAVAMG